MDARERAIHYLNIKPRTRQQVIGYLKTKGFTEAEISESIRELEQYHYIDDLNYSRMYFEYGFEKGRGMLRLKRELSEKGVAADVIQMACQQLEDIPDQFEAALAIGERMMSDLKPEEMDYADRKKLQARIGRRLMNRGFSADVVYRVIGRLIP